MTTTSETNNIFDKLSPETQELLTSSITTVKYVLKKHEEICQQAREVLDEEGIARGIGHEFWCFSCVQGFNESIGVDVADNR